MPVATTDRCTTVSIKRRAPERVRVPLGEIEAWKLALTSSTHKRQPVGDNIAVWISSDARRLPVKMQADLPVGNFVLYCATPSRSAGTAAPAPIPIRCGRP